MKKRNRSTGSASVDKALKTNRPTVAQVDAILAQHTEPYAAPTDERRVDWLLLFVQRNLAALRVGEAIDLSTDVIEYLDPRAVFVQGAEAVEGLKAIARERIPRPAYVPVSEVGTEAITEADVFTLPRATLQELQVAIREGMRRLENGEDWVISTPPKMVVQRAGKTLVRSYYAGAILPVLVASTVDLLVSVWPRIGRCQYDRCNKLFRRDHGSKQYCTPQCSQNARSHRMGRDFKQEYSRRWDSDRKKGKK
jgi:hypothetical protein